MSSGKGRGKGKTRRAQVANACMGCRAAKLKCSGGHPICNRCRDRGSDCSYDVTEGMTKRQQLRLDLTEQGQELDRVMVILQHLQNASDQEATETLARLRVGRSLENEYHRISARRADQNNLIPQTNGQAAENNTQDRDLAAQNRRLLSLLTPEMQSQLQLGALDAWNYSSSIASPATMESYISPENGNTWGGQDLSTVDQQSHQTAGSSTQQQYNPGTSGIAPDYVFAGQQDPQYNGM